MSEENHAPNLRRYLSYTLISTHWIIMCGATRQHSAISGSPLPERTDQLSADRQIDCVEFWRVLIMAQ